MYAQAIFYALAIVPLVSAHGKIAVVTGDLGGNGTALGIRGAVVPGAGPNHKTEVDTTVFWSKNIDTDGDIGYTQKAGNNQLSDLKKAMALSGDTLPQVSSGGSVQGTYHIVTSDGAGPLEALVDETATGKWSQAKSADVTTQVPGKNGWISAKNAKNSQNDQRDLKGRMIGDLSKRRTAVNINEDYPFAINIPAGTSCTGTVSGQSNVCLVKVSNNNENGPFGGVFAVQMPSNATNAKH